MDEAIEWVKRCPNPMDGEAEIEIRQVFEAEDFGDALTPELREQEAAAAREQSARRSARSSVARAASTPTAAIEAVWRIESARLIAGLTRIVRDVGLAEDLAQDALVAALEQWPRAGVPDNPGAWLMATAQAPGDRRDPPRRERSSARASSSAASSSRSERTAPDLDARRSTSRRRRPAAADVHRLPPGAVHATRGWRSRCGCSAA